MTDRFLIDANVLIALTVSEHEHHETAQAWLKSVERVAICPIVQGSLARFLLRSGECGSTVASVLSQLRTMPKLEFWNDDLDYADIRLDGLRGQKQVTDTYLAALAAAHHGRLATFDRALCELRPEQTWPVGDHG